MPTDIFTAFSSRQMNVVYGRKDSRRKNKFLFSGGGRGFGLGWPQTLEFDAVPPQPVITGACFKDKQKHGS